MLDNSDTPELIETGRRLLQALVSVDKTAVFALLGTAYEEGGAPKVGDLLRTALEEIGDAWERGSMSLAQVYMSGIISEEAIHHVLSETHVTDTSLPLIGSAVFLDHHGLGMRIVSSLVRSAGYPLKDLGLGADTVRTVDFVGKENIRILLVSVLMLPSALAVEELCREMARLHPEVRIVVGGAPFRLDEGLWKRVGAHAMGKNAGEIFDILHRLRKELV
jgi:methanogenic corrinoid protein MtbC1